jgi:PKD repeat protein
LCGTNTTIGTTFTAGYIYSWSPIIGLNSATVSNPTLSLVNLTGSPVTYTYTVTAIKMGCTATDQVIVTVNPAPLTNVGSDIITCSPAVNFTSATGAMSYSWNFGDGSTSTLQNPSHTFGSAGTYQATLVVTSSLSCTAIDTLMVTLNPSPTITPGLDFSVCLGAAKSFAGTTVGATSWVWDFGDGNTSSVQNPSYTYVSSGVYQVVLTAMSSMGCIKKDTVIATINPNPLTTITSTNISCFGMANGSATITTSGGTPPYTYNWFPGTPVGQGTTNITNLASGSYYAIVSDSKGCSQTSTSVNVIAPTQINIAAPTITHVNCFGGNNGTASCLVAGGTLPYTYTWMPSGGTANTANNLTAGSYTLTVVDSKGCSQNSGIATILQPPVLLANAGADKIKCFGDSALLTGLVTGGKTPYTFNWSNGATTQATLVGPTITTSYTYTVTDANGCTKSDTAIVNIMPSTDIYGHVSYSGGAIAQGKNRVALIKHLGFKKLFDTVQTTITDASGNYHFAAIKHGNYLIKVFADTSKYKKILPTYYGNRFLWDSAMVLIHDCNVNDTADIIMVEPSTATGPGIIKGKIVKGLGYGRTPGEPIPGIDIKLGKNPGGSLMQSTITDSSGTYTFGNVPVNATGESYTVYVDIPGLPRDSSYSVTVGGTTTQFNNLDYKVDSASIYVTTTVGISNVEMAHKNKFVVYPNPFKESTTVEYSIADDAVVTLEVYNVLGTKVNTITSAKQVAGNYKYKIEQPNTGIYFITLTINGRASTQRIIVTE